MDGFTGLQRFFLSYASIWRTKNRDELAEQYLQIDPHSPAEFRTNGIASNVDLFYDAFGVTEGDAMCSRPRTVCVFGNPRYVKENRCVCLDYRRTQRFFMMYGWHSEFGITGIGRFGETVDVGLLGHGLWLIGVGVRLRHDGIGHGRSR